MQVSGFTFVRNAIKYAYPVVESIRSILPLVDEYVVCVGGSEDETEALIRSIGSPKIRILPSVWDESLREGGAGALAVETDKALRAVSPHSDWCIYLQADEVVHEKYLEGLQRDMAFYLDNPAVEGLLFRYEHFYGSYRLVGDSRRWYSHEVRIVRNDPQIHSYKDAQGFRKADRKLRVKPVDACIYHYGWVKDPSAQEKKLQYFPSLWRDDKDGWKNGVKACPKRRTRSLKQNIDSLGSLFRAAHPAVMQATGSPPKTGFSISTQVKSNLKP